MFQPLTARLDAGNQFALHHLVVPRGEYSSVNDILGNIGVSERLKLCEKNKQKNSVSHIFTSRKVTGNYIQSMEVNCGLEPVRLWKGLGIV